MPDAPLPYVHPDEITPDQFAVLAENTVTVGAALDELIVARVEHRRSGCLDWYCNDPDISVCIAVLLEPHQLAMLLGIAVDRLAVYAEELDRNNEGAA